MDEVVIHVEDGIDDVAHGHVELRHGLTHVVDVSLGKPQHHHSRALSLLTLPSATASTAISYTCSSCCSSPVELLCLSVH